MKIQYIFILVLGITVLLLPACFGNEGDEGDDLNRKVVGSTAIYSIHNENILNNKLTFNQWLKCISETGGTTLAELKKDEFYISILKVNEGCIAAHIHALQRDIDYSSFVYLFDDKLIDASIGRGGEINFHRILLNGKYLSDGVLLRFDANRNPSRARIEIRFSDDDREIIIPDIDLVNPSNK